MLHLVMPAASNHRISVLLVDDHALVRKCLQRALEDDAGLSVVGTAASGLEALKLAGELAKLRRPQS